MCPPRSVVGAMVARMKRSATHTFRYCVMEDTSPAAMSATVRKRRPGKWELAMADTRTQIAAVLFRPAPGGYVYREPYGWPFGEAPHYLVNEDQKAAIMEITLSKRPILAQVILWGTLC